MFLYLDVRLFITRKALDQFYSNFDLGSGKITGMI